MRAQFWLYVPKHGGIRWRAHRKDAFAPRDTQWVLVTLGFFWAFVLVYCFSFSSYVVLGLFVGTGLVRFGVYYFFLFRFFLYVMCAFGWISLFLMRIIYLATHFLLLVCAVVFACLLLGFVSIRFLRFDSFCFVGAL